MTNTLWTARVIVACKATSFQSSCITLLRRFVQNCLTHPELHFATQIVLVCDRKCNCQRKSFNRKLEVSDTEIKWKLNKFPENKFLSCFNSALCSRKYFSGEINSKHWERYQWSFWHFGAYFGFFSWNSHICNKCQVQQRMSGVTGFFLRRGIGNLILWSNIAGTLYYRSLCTTPFFCITLSITTVVCTYLLT